MNLYDLPTNKQTTRNGRSATCVDSDGTGIFSLAPTLTGGSKKTVAFTIKHRKPWIHIHRGGPYEPADLLLHFISDHRIKILNVARSRASKEPEIATLGVGG